MRLSEDKVALIRAANGIYRASDVAREYAVHPSTVVRIWNNRTHRQVRKAPEVPNITTKPRPRDLVDDVNILLGRGMSYREVAETLGISIGAVALKKGVLL